MAKEGVNHRNRQERAVLEKARARARAKGAVVRGDLSTNMKKCTFTKKAMEEGQREQKAQQITRTRMVEIYVAREMQTRIEWLPSEKRKTLVCKE